jgi:hypothetical protein
MELEEDLEELLTEQIDLLDEHVYPAFLRDSGKYAENRATNGALTTGLGSISSSLRQWNLSDGALDDGFFFRSMQQLVALARLHCESHVIQRR